MKKHRFVYSMIALLLLLACTTTALATGTTLKTSGSCKKAYTTSDSLTKTSTQTWSEFRMVATTITYTGGAVIYAYARPVAADGTVYGTRQKVYTTAQTTYTPNASGASANTVKMKIENGWYIDTGATTVTLTFAGTATGVH